MGAHRELPAHRPLAARLLIGLRLRWALAAVAVAAGVSPPAGAMGASGWSPPATLGGCAAQGAPAVVFPSDGPTHATGPGAIVWSAGPGCAGGARALVSAIGPQDVPRAASPVREPGGRTIAFAGPLAVGAGPRGRIVIAGAAHAGGDAEGLFTQGPAGGGPFAAPAGTLGPAGPVALATAYLGDVAIASPLAGGRRGGGIELRVERHEASAFGRPVPVSVTGEGPVEELRVALDYRSDALVVWSARGVVYARELAASGAIHPIERLAAGGSQPSIAALLSDDDRAIVAWADRGGGQTNVYLDISAPGVRFGRPRLLERFANPDGLRSPQASPSLVRLSSESVMMAWAGSAEGRWVVRAAPVDLDGVQAIETVSAGGEADALLAGLAAGPRDDAVILWTEPRPAAAGSTDLSRQAIFAARGADASPGASVFGAPALVSPVGPTADPSIAVDPASDRAVTVWRGAGGEIEYATSAGGGTSQG